MLALKSVRDSKTCKKKLYKNCKTSKIVLCNSMQNHVGQKKTQKDELKNAQDITC